MEQVGGNVEPIEQIEPVPIKTVAETANQIIEQIGSAVVADVDFFELLLTGVIARGHVHVEDVPGTGKTLAAQVLAETLGMSFSRVQFTPDLLPADITGSHIYDEVDAEFEFQRGPIFANVVLADEINRAPPKTQAALLEAMGEKQVSMDGTSYALPRPFFVIATQNPVEQEGTFELPEAQRDRFSIKTQMGYPGHEGELELLDRRGSRRTQVPSVDTIIAPEDVRRIQVTAEEVGVRGEIKEYIVNLAEHTRDDPRINIGVSPRGVQKMFEAARARAVLQTREYVTPDDVKRLASPIYGHRLVLTTDASIRDVDPDDLIAEALEAVSVPGMEQQ